MILDSNFDDAIKAENIGGDIYRLVEELYPICRSITGNGVRKSLEIIAKHISLEVKEVATGTPVFDWAVPREWNINDAYIKNGKGERIVDFNKHNLHVLNYSIPVHKKVTLEELKNHIYTLPDHPDWIPYRTSYYHEKWGFCLTHNQLENLEEDTYEVCIDSSHKDGYLTYGEFCLKGETDDEILLSAHICHPSLANDNLSGIALLTFLAKILQKSKHRYTYRFLFAPGTIGAITWLARNENIVHKIKHGLVIACVGDGGGPTYKRSRMGNADMDRAVAYVLNRLGPKAVIEDFSPYGYDERQYCSPGFNLPVGLLQRSKYGKFPQYHTSADDLTFITPDNLAESLSMTFRILHILECNATYVNLNPKCEPQLGRRGLYKAIGADKAGDDLQMAMLWILNLSDGTNSLLDIAERCGMDFSMLLQSADLLEKNLLLRKQKSSG